MILEQIRFAAVALLCAVGVFSLFVSILGTYRFHFALNRIHSAAISDTACMFFIIIALVLASGFSMTSAKLLLILAFMWFTSPLSSHMLTSLEYHTDEHLEKHLEFHRLDDDREDENGNS